MSQYDGPHVLPRGPAVHEDGAVAGPAHDDADGAVAQVAGPHLGPGHDVDDVAVGVDDLDQLASVRDGRLPGHVDRRRHHQLACDGEPLDLAGLAKDKAVLVVNVASKCGLTPQYEGLEQLHEELSGRGFTVLGVPCNQFGGQEPGTRRGDRRRSARRPTA